jgi:hypothetical protein
MRESLLLQLRYADLTRKACRWHGAIGFAGRRSSRAGRRQCSRTAMTPTRSMARSSCPIRSRTCGWNMCRTNPREFKPRSGGASAPRTTSSWSRASLMSLPQPPRKIRWNIAVLCSTNRRVPRPCSIWPPRSQAGASPCRKAQAAACRCRMCLAATWRRSPRSRCPRTATLRSSVSPARSIAVSGSIPTPSRRRRKAPSSMV